MNSLNLTINTTTKHKFAAYTDLRVSPSYVLEHRPCISTKKSTCDKSRTHLRTIIGKNSIPAMYSVYFRTHYNKHRDIHNANSCDPAKISLVLRKSFWDHYTPRKTTVQFIDWSVYSKTFTRKKKIHWNSPTCFVQSLGVEICKCACPFLERGFWLPLSGPTVGHIWRQFLYVNNPL